MIILFEYLVINLIKDLIASVTLILVLQLGSFLAIDD